MSTILDKAYRELQKAGYRAKTVSISHLSEVQESVAKLVREGTINAKLHKNWHFYMDDNKNLPEAKMIFIIAIPEPITRAKFEWQGKTYNADIPPTYIYENDENHAEQILQDAFHDSGYRIARAHLALKTLAVRSGLARYGKNNITYVTGMGSFHRLVAFYSDCPVKGDNWHEAKVMKSCTNCNKCMEKCSTGSISTDRFLIHAENCLTWLNENEEDFTDRVKPDWHNAMVGCMRCQLVCPVNRSQINKITEGPHFSEKETRLVLQKIPFQKLPEPTQKKLVSISGDYWYDIFSRNLDLLIKSQNL